jgi:hypothetical protein
MSFDLYAKPLMTDNDFAKFLIHNPVTVTM